MNLPPEAFSDLNRIEVRLGVAEENLAAVRYQRDEVEEIARRLRAFVQWAARLDRPTQEPTTVEQVATAARELLYDLTPKVFPRKPGGPFIDEPNLGRDVVTVALPDGLVA